MNRVSLSAHPVGLIFALVIYVINPPWNAGTVPVCMMILANLAALGFGGVRKSTGRHSAGLSGDTSLLETLKWKLGWKLPTEWLWPGQTVAPQFLAPTPPMTATDYFSFGVVGSAFVLSGGIVGLMYLIILGGWL